METAGRQVTLEARCVWCGPVRMAGPALCVRVGPGRSAEALFEFVCPECGRQNFGPLGPSEVDALARAGVRASAGPAPFELLERRAGPPIGWDDLIDFHDELRRIDAEASDGGPHREHDADAGPVRAGRERDAA